MRQLVQEVGSGSLRLVEVPRPQIGPTEVLVKTSYSMLSAGTERAVRRLASASLVGKARARPDLLRQVIRRARSDGLRPTLDAVRHRLDSEMPLGYSAAGSVVEVGEAVQGVRPGQLVATGGAGHSDMQVVAGQLACGLPVGVTEEEAAFVTIGSIALHGLRLADIGPGSMVCVVGLGLVGQIAVRLALAAGHDVVGIDLREWSVERARASGARALVELGLDSTEAVLDWSRGRGADAVLVTAATPSSDPIRRAPAIARDRANVVVVGDVGLDIARAPFYEKELTLKFARSYGPGRYDRSYEDWGVDYPVGHVRWTEGRNMEAVLDLLSSGRLEVSDLISHRFPFSRATDAYKLIETNSEPFLGIQLTYDDPPLEPQQQIAFSRRRTNATGVGLIGAGNFARSTLVPSLRRAGFTQFVSVASASGLSARRLAEREGFGKATDSAELVISDPAVGAVVIATTHSSHARLVVAALEAGKHVFCEKPLCLSEEELVEIESAWRSSGAHLMVGFNRRYSSAAEAVHRLIGGEGGPILLAYRISAGRLPRNHWYEDRREGGRLLGEVCHFVDTCAAVVGVPVSSVYAVGGGRAELLLEDELSLLVTFDDGSSAVISYTAGGHPATSKERLEALGRGHTALIDDFRTMTLDGALRKDISSGKGHDEQIERFYSAVTEGADPAKVTDSAIATTAAMFAAVQSLRTGQPCKPRRFELERAN